MLRAILGGVLYENCRLQGVPGRALGYPEVYRLPSRIEAETISKLVGIHVGLGYAGKNDAVASAYRLEVTVNRRPRADRASNGKISGRRLQRIVLLTLNRRNRRSVEYFENGSFKINLKVTRDIRRDALELAVRGLILALTLSGVGKGSRRGLGSFDVVRVRPYGLPMLASLERDPKDFIERTIELARQVVARSGVVTGGRVGRCSPRFLPPMPVYSSAVFRGMRVSEVYKIVKPWVDVHEFFVRPKRCQRLHGSSICRDDLRVRLAAWILGLPRGRGRSSGYQLPRRSRITRRASPVIVSYHTMRHILGEGVFVSFLVSADWPSTLEWRGAHRQIINIDDNRIMDAMDTARREFFQYLDLSQARPVWP